jgi:hypothetical protein
MRGEPNEQSDTAQSWVRVLDLYSEILQTPAGAFYLPLATLIQRLMATWLPSRFVAGQSLARFYFALPRPDNAPYSPGEHVLVQLAPDGKFDCRHYKEDDAYDNPSERQLCDIDSAQEVSLAFAGAMIRPQS